MKIGYLCSDFDVPLFGGEGCSLHVREFTNALVEAGHEVFIVSASLGNGSPTGVRARVYHPEPGGLDAKTCALLEEEALIQHHHLERDLRSVLWNMWLQSVGAAILERERPDFLYERYALFGWGGVALSHRYDVPLILEVNAPLCLEQAGYERFTLTRMAQHLEREILHGADTVIVVTRWLREWAVSLGVEPSRIRVLANAVSARLVGVEVSGERVRARHQLEGRRVVGFVGSFHWWHDVKGLVAAFAALYTHDPAVRLLLVGDGEERTRLQKLVRELGLAPAVVFTGHVPHEQVPEHLAAMDVVAVPYGPLKDFYFSPLKLFECMAVGRPTVAAAIGQIAEVVEHRKTGWLYPPGDTEALADGIRALLDEPALAEAIGVAAASRVAARHTWRAVTSEVTEIARALVGRAERASSRLTTGHRV